MSRRRIAAGSSMRHRTRRQRRIVEHTTMIERSCFDVWDVFADVSAWPSWTPTLKAVQFVEGARLCLGARVRISQPRLAASEWTVTAFEDGRSWRWESRRLGVRTIAGHVLEPIPPGHTTVTQRVEQRGPLAVLVRLAYGRPTRHYLKLESVGLRAACEGKVIAG